MKEVKIKVTADTSGAEQSIGSLAKETDKVAKSIENTNEATENLTGQLDTMSGGAVTGFKKFTSGLKMASKGFKTLRGAIISTGLGALVVIVGALIANFKTSEEGQNRMAKAMGAIGAITGVLTDGLSYLGGLIIDIFTKPQQVFADFGKAIKEFVMDKVDKVVEGFGLMGSALKKLFSGDIKGAFKDATSGIIELNRGLNPVVMGVEALANGITKVVKEMSKEAKIAMEIADMRAKADKLDRALITERAEADRERADLLQKAIDKENYTTAQRIEFLKQAGKVEDEITQKEIEAAQLRLNAKIKENALGLSTKEDLIEEAELRADLINLETTKLTKAKEVTSQIIALNAEEVASNKAKSDAKLATQKEEQEKAKALKDKYDAFTTNTEEEKRVAAQDKLRTEFEALLAQMGDDEEAKLELTKSYLEKQQALTDEYADAEEAKRNEAAAKEIADAKAVKDAIEGVQQAELNTISNGIGLIKQLGEESRGLQAAALIGESAVGIANMTINKGKADLAAQPLLSNPATAAAGVTALALNKVNLGIGIATNVAATAKGLSALKKGGAPAGGGAEAGGTAQAPSFNLVEGTDGTSQIQRSIEGLGDAPIKAYVTSGDVTSAQAADRAAEANSGF